MTRESREQAIARLRGEGFRFGITHGRIHVTWEDGTRTSPEWDLGWTGLPGSLFGGHVAQAIRIAESWLRSLNRERRRDAEHRALLGGP